MAATAYLFAAGLGWVWMVYNSLIDLRQRVRQAWSQVDVQLKRRHDLIPNLVETVKGLRRSNEAEVFFVPKSASLRRRLPFLNTPCRTITAGR